MSIQIIISAETADEAIGDIAKLAETLAGEVTSQASASVTDATTAAAASSAPLAPAPTIPDAAAAAAASSAPPAPVAPQPPAIPAAFQRDPDPAPAPAAVAAPAFDVDTRGYAWDARIHTAAKTKMKTGEWKKSRGKDAALVATVEAELAAAAATAAPAPVPAPAAVAPAPVPAPAAVAPAPVPAAVAPAPAPAATAAELYPQVATKISNAIMANMVSPARCAEILAKHGANAIPELVDNAPALTAVGVAFDMEIAAYQDANPGPSAA